MPRQTLDAGDVIENPRRAQGLKGRARERSGRAMGRETRSPCFSNLCSHYRCAADAKPRSDKGRARQTSSSSLAAVSPRSLLFLMDLIRHSHSRRLGPTVSLLLFSVGTYRKQLLKAGLNKQQMRTRRVVHRRFRAQFPGELFELDLTGLKNSLARSGRRAAF